jgi:hypothetical protein
MSEAAATQVKEVFMDVDGGGSAQIGGGEGKTRRRRGGRRSRRTQKGGASEEVAEAHDVAVHKEEGAAPVQTGGAVPAVYKKKVAAPAPAPTPAPAGPPPKVVIAPPKKKPVKIMLVPKKQHVAPRPQKTFKAKRVRVVIDNTAKTQKRRRMTIARVEAMTEDQLRETAVAMKLSRIETVKKVPVDLLRQMLKDYYTMRGMLL